MAVWSMPPHTSNILNTAHITINTYNYSQQTYQLATQPFLIGAFVLSACVIACAHFAKCNNKWINVDVLAYWNLWIELERCVFAAHRSLYNVMQSEWLSLTAVDWIRQRRQHTAKPTKWNSKTSGINWNSRFQPFTFCQLTPTRQSFALAGDRNVCDRIKNFNIENECRLWQAAQTKSTMTKHNFDMVDNNRRPPLDTFHDRTEEPVQASSATTVAKSTKLIN